MRLLASLVLMGVALQATPAVAKNPNKGVPDRFVTGEHRKFPREEWVIGLGSGSSFDEARGQASRSVAAQISASLQSSQTMVGTHSSQSEGRKRSTQETEDYMSEVAITTEFEQAELIETLEVFEKKGRVWVITGLNKARASQAIQSRMTSSLMELQAAMPKDKDGLTALRRSQLEPIADRARREWAVLAAITGGSGMPSELQMWDSMPVAQGDAHVSVCLFDEAGVALEYSLSEQLAASAGSLGWGGCDRTRAGAVVLNGGVRAELSDGMCTTRVDFRLADNTGAELMSGRAGGPVTRAEGASDEAACAASAQKLLGDLHGRVEGANF